MRIAFPITKSPKSFLTYTDDPLFAGHCLNKGFLIFYPTETFYALGCKCDDTYSIENIIKLKKRPLKKSLPLIAANFKQAASYCELSKAPLQLLKTFWPGPLSLILPAKKSLHPALINNGKIAIRISSSPFARSLALQSGELIISSSANISGQAPVCQARDLDYKLLENVNSSNTNACILSTSYNSYKEKASTIIEPIYNKGKCYLHILRSGVITEKMLLEKNFKLII